MKPVHTIPLLVAAVLAVPLTARSAPDAAPTPAPEAPAQPQVRPDAAEPAVIVHNTTGEITDLAERSFRIRPWHYQLPARIQVTATPATRYFKQSEGKPRDVQVGDLVLVVPEEAPIRHEKSFYVLLKPNGRPDPPKKTPEARAVIRLWNVGKEKIGPDAVSQEDRRNAHVLLQGASPYFVGGNQGGIDRPVKKEKLYTGVVTSLSPMAVQTANGVQEFRLDDDTLVVNHQEIKPDALNKGETVIVRSPTKAGADASLQADLVAVCPKPDIGARSMGKLLSREKKRKER